MIFTYIDFYMSIKQEKFRQVMNNVKTQPSFLTTLYEFFVDQGPYDSIIMNNSMDVLMITVLLLNYLLLLPLVLEFWRKY